MSIKNDFIQITEEKDNIVNKSLFIGIVLGSITFLITLIGISRSSTPWFVLFDLIPLTILMVSYFNRKNLTIQLRVNSILIALFILFLADIYKNGVFADNKILFALVPIFCFLVYSLRKTIIIFLSGIILYLILSYLYISENIISKINHEIRLKSFDVWIINVLLLCMSAFVILIIYKVIINRFATILEELQNKNSELEILKNNLEIIVAERTNDLEAVNEELRTSNEELLEKSEIIKKQNFDLSHTMIELQSAQNQLIQSEKMASLGILTAGIAHELNNPLNFIKGGYLGLQEICNMTDNQHKDDAIKLFKSIEIGVERATSIIQGLNQLNRSTESKNEKCNINKIIDNCLLILQHEIKDRIVIEINSDKEYEIIGNSGKLHQVFLNICHNAAQAISDKGKIEITINSKKNNVQIIIKDSGCGISKENLQKISNPFFTTKQPGKGTGLGLSIAYSIVYEHKGTIDINSELEVGTTVIITLPISND